MRSKSLRLKSSALLMRHGPVRTMLCTLAHIFIQPEKLFRGRKLPLGRNYRQVIAVKQLFGASTPVLVSILHFWEFIYRRQYAVPYLGLKTAIPIGFIWLGQRSGPYAPACHTLRYSKRARPEH